MSGDEAQTSLAFDVIATIANSIPGVAPITGRVWEFDVDDHWSIAVNGDAAPKASAERDGRMSFADIPAYHCVIWFNGWIAGLIAPYGGGTMAMGTAANEATFLEALRACLDRRAIAYDNRDLLDAGIASLHEELAPYLADAAHYGADVQQSFINAMLAEGYAVEQLNADGTAFRVVPPADSDDDEDLPFL